MTQNFHADPKLFDLLGKDIYKDMYQPFIELVANSYDADSSKIEITLALDNDSNDDRIIMLQDFGHGMDNDDLKNRFFNISVSDQPVKSPNGRIRKGQRGVGRLAGFTLGPKLKYKTVKDGYKYQFELNLNDIKQKNNIENINVDIQKEVTTEKSGVVIIISDIQALDIPLDTLKQKLLANFGAHDDFSIYINSQELKAAELLGEKEEFIISIGDQKAIGWIVYSPDKLVNYGILIKSNQRAIGESETFGVKLPKELMSHFYGEIDITYIDGIECNAGWDSLFDNERAKELKECLRDIFFNAANKQVDLEVEDEFRKNMAIPEYRHRIENLPSFSQKAAEQTIKDSIKTIKYNKKDLVKTIMELSIKSYEQHEVYEILKRLNEARSEDITKLAAVLKQWGIKEVADILTILQQRFKVLDAFEQIINDPKTLELKGTHKVLAENIWIVDERYEWFISNKSLKTISGNLLDSAYSGEHSSKRPDLFIRMQENLLMRNEFLILELKKPGQSIKFEDKAQGERYASVIHKTFTKEAFFNVYIVGSEYEEGIQRESTAGTIRTIAISYQELVQEARARMIYIQKNLQDKEEEIAEELYRVEEKSV
ncbi:MAG: ATP-binding protein [Sulfuricurvum sp.]